MEVVRNSVSILEKLMIFCRYMMSPSTDVKIHSMIKEGYHVFLLAVANRELASELIRIHKEQLKSLKDPTLMSNEICNNHPLFFV